MAEAPNIARWGESPMVPTLWEIHRRQRESVDTVTLSMAPVAGPCPPAHPGQFQMLSAFGIGESAISLSGDLSRSDVRLHTIRAVGAVTRALTAAKKGDVVGVRGPFGTAWDIEAAHGHDVVVMAGGIGLAPVKPIIHHVLRHRRSYGRLILLYGARTPADMIFAKQLSRWKDSPQVKVFVTVDQSTPEWNGHVGLVTRLLTGRVTVDPLFTTAYICGPEVMMRCSAEELMQRGVPSSQIQVSLERNMRCAVGHCGHCQYGAKFVCKDGPVFRYPQARPLFLTREL